LRYLGLATAPSARRWLKYLIIIGLYLGAQVGFETLAGGKRLSLGSVDAALTLPAFLALAASAFLEELLFRGLLLHDLATILRRWGANLLTSLLFVAIRLPFWLSHGGLSATLLANAGGVFLFSLLVQPAGRMALPRQRIHLAAGPRAHRQQRPRALLDRLGSVKEHGAT
jgi:membrane protease YdiL (CAAX protease family)